MFLHLGRTGKLTLLGLVGREKKNRHFHSRFREVETDRQESVCLKGGYGTGEIYASEKTDS